MRYFPFPLTSHKVLRINSVLWFLPVCAYLNYKHENIVSAIEFYQILRILQTIILKFENIYSFLKLLFHKLLELTILLFTHFNRLSTVTVEYINVTDMNFYKCVIA